MLVCNRFSKVEERGAGVVISKHLSSCLEIKFKTLDCFQPTFKTLQCPKSKQYCYVKKNLIERGGGGVREVF